MKKIAPHIRNKRGSMLMFTLIVFMVILILGMTMITSMLYSQGENNMQINKQKAYYAALSAVDSVKAYFLNPKLDSSISSPHELIGEKCTYNLKEQGIDEDTTVEISIVRDEDESEYILISATGICNGEKSIVTAKIREEVQKGASGGLFGERIALACQVLHKNPMEPLIVDGNIFINDENGNTSQGVVLHAVHFLNSNENQQANNLYIKATENSISMNSNVLNNVYIQTGNRINLDKNEINNLYVQSIQGTDWIGANFSNNKIKQQMQLFAGNRFPTLYDNEIGTRLIVDVTRDRLNSGTLTNTSASTVYITGAKEINAGYLTGASSKPVDTLYTNAKINGEYQTWHNVKDIKGISESDLASIDLEEQKIGNVIADMQTVSEILQEKPIWPRPEENSKFVKVEKGVGTYPQNKEGSHFEEYYNSDEKIRLVFSDNYDYFKIKTEGWGYSNEQDVYIISEEHADDQIFFILQNAMGVDFYTFSEDHFDALYVYAPTATCQFKDKFKYLKGSIIARQININNTAESITFRAPENIDGIGVPGGTESTGSSSSTTYTYHFEEYIENDND